MNEQQMRQNNRDLMKKILDRNKKQPYITKEKMSNSKETSKNIYEGYLQMRKQFSETWAKTAPSTKEKQNAPVDPKKKEETKQKVMEEIRGVRDRLSGKERREKLLQRPQPNQPPTASEPVVSTPVERGSEPMVSIPPMGGMGGFPSMYGSLQMTTPYRPNYDAFFQQYGGMMGSFGSPQLKQTQNPLLDAFRAGLMNRTFGG